MDEDAGRLSRRGFLGGHDRGGARGVQRRRTATTAPRRRRRHRRAREHRRPDDNITAVDVSSALDGGRSPRRPSPVVTSDPFTLGVASGDPLPDAVVLWTRLLPADPLPATDIEVEWEVATDAELTDVVAAGSAVAVAALGHSVHIDVTGLEPDTEYHYRFRVAGFATPAARTRTFAAPGTTPERFRFAFSSCQNWEHGYYAAYRDLVEQGDLDAFVFLGDYIYENPAGGCHGPAGPHDRPDLRVRDDRAVPRALRALQGRPAVAGRPHARAVGHHVGRPRGGQRLRGSEQRSRRTHPTRSSPAVPPDTRSGTSTCRCASTHRAGPTTRSTARSRTATSCASTCSTPVSTGPTSSAAHRSWRRSVMRCRCATTCWRRRPNRRCSVPTNVSGCSTGWRRRPRSGT